MRRQIEHRFTAARLFVLSEHRHKRLRKCAFGKQATQEVGNLEGNQEYISCTACSKCDGKHLITNEAQDSRQKGHKADNRP
jgi:hypothetical protein